MAKFKRILLKLSGESLMGKQSGRRDGYSYAYSYSYYNDNKQGNDA